MKTIYAAYAAITGLFLIHRRSSEQHVRFLQSLAANEKTQCDVVSESEGIRKVIRENEKNSGIRLSVGHEAKV